MILSHRHKFIFIKTRKTAGTSIEVSLSRYCGPNDIITPISLRDEAILDSYFLFTFERNPFDKVVSDYWYRASDREMDDYLEEGPLPVDLPEYSIDGRVAVDFVGRFENLKDDLQTALQRVGIEFDGWLPRAKSGFRKSTFTVHDLTAQQRDRIRTEFRREIGEFGYTFPDRKKPS